MSVDSKSLARQALRHIREPEVLRSNPLTCRFFRAALNVESSLMTVRAIIMAALPQGSRARRIVEECDFNERSHKAVRAEMVLSERQFYRERSLAFELIARALQHQPGSVTNADTRLVLRIESMNDQLADGHAGMARRAADQLLAGGVPRWATSRLLALKAAAFAATGEAADAAQALRQAEDKAVGDVERADVLAARAMVPYLAGSLREALALVGDAVNATGGQAILSDPAGLRAHVRHLLWFANIHEEGDDAAESLRLTEYANGLLLSRAPNELSLVGIIKLDTACITLCLPGESTRALEELHDAQALAARVCSPSLMAKTEFMMAVAKVVSAPSEALAHARLAVELALNSLGGEPLARALLTCARVMTLCGDAAGAIGLIDIARLHCLPGRYIEAISVFRHADALALLGLDADAARLAEQACSRIASVNRSHYLGSAHVTAGAANAALGRASEAMDHLGAAIPLLETAGFMFELKRAHKIAARITGDRIYVERADEIGRVMAAS